MTWGIGSLAEWRHLLEGAQHPILIWTDHKNLTYIRDAKRLGPRQARSDRRPRNCLFVPTAVRSKVLQWGHASQLACHPGATHTADFIRRHFWWPTLEADMQEFVAAYNVCSRSKASHRPPAGLRRLIC